MENIRYYCLLTNQQLDTEIPESIRVYMGYSENYKLRQAIFGEVLETVGGLYLCNCLLRSAPYIDNNCCERELTPEEVPMWRQYVGEIFTDKSGIELKDPEQIILYY